jgi:hypothetical protein
MMLPGWLRLLAPPGAVSDLSDTQRASRWAVPIQKRQIVCSSVGGDGLMPSPHRRIDLDQAGETILAPPGSSVRPSGQVAEVLRRPQPKASRFNGNTEWGQSVGPRHRQGEGMQWRAASEFRRRLPRSRRRTRRRYHGAGRRDLSRGASNHGVAERFRPGAFARYRGAQSLCHSISSSSAIPGSFSLALLVPNRATSLPFRGAPPIGTA